MNKETTEQLARAAALEAVKEFEKSQKKLKRVKVFQNAKKLMENYNRICQSVQEGVSELSDVDDGEELVELSAEDIYINSIIKCKLRSIVMIAHIDKCLKLLEEEMVSKETPWKYDAFKYSYLDGQTQEDIAEMLDTTDRTVRRWISELTGILSIYLFGADAIVLD
ncbi:sigma factor-like helix-turn-helix DNA-binding protein [Lacrimispora celerecrescens]|uniref:sigma factor-like helix-turn-helix DNA-binding protein n=1 Tax=Lacrimispora celerecrescens TaxID=29354 RepID=UPI0016451B27|nr:sigma factor-like helix-turn-helix DNA-binding protein [Lacrimispora celerecrescens]